MNTLNNGCRILVVGDLHGKNQPIAAAYAKFITEKYDKLLFIGDYVDAFPPVTDKEIIDCLTSVIELARNNPNIILLYGNHELSYLYSHYRASGYRKSIAPKIYQLLTDNKDLFKWYYFDSKILFTHAGINWKWLEQCKLRIKERYPEFEFNDILELLDFLPQTSLGTDLLCQCGEVRGGFRYDHGGILWCDKEELIKAPFFDDKIYCQVVGHTATKDIEIVNVNSQRKLVFIDCLNTKTKIKFYEHN